MPIEPSDASESAATPDELLARRAAAVTIRPVRFDDLDNILALIEPFVERDVLLPRSEGELIELLPSSFVAEDAGRLVGYVGLEIYSIKLAEVRSLAVATDHQRLGIGQRLVQACVDLARRKGIIEVMAITSKEDFFRLCGFDFTLPGEKKALFIHTTQSWRVNAVDVVCRQAKTLARLEQRSGGVQSFTAKPLALARLESRFGTPWLKRLEERTIDYGVGGKRPFDSVVYQP